MSKIVLDTYWGTNKGWKSGKDGRVLGATPLFGTPYPFYGAAVGGNSAPTALESSAGRPIGVHRTYFVSGQEASLQSMAATDVAAGRIPWVSIKLPDTWANAKNGSCDAWAQGIISGLASLSGPVMLTWHHEPETDETPISDFVAMHDRLYQFSKPYNNIRCGPIFTGYDVIPQYGPAQDPAKWGDYSLDVLYPGAFTSGDFIGMDAYCYKGTAKNGSWFYIGDTYWRPLADFAASKGVTWAIGEYGISNDAADYDRSLHGDVTWLREAWTTALELSDTTARCLALSYFDSGLNSTTNLSDGTPAWPLETDDGTPSKLDVFLDIVQTSPAVEGAWPGGM